jgi:hypothetical protein
MPRSDSQGVAALSHEVVREALRLLGDPDPPAHRGAAQRALRARLAGYGTVRSALERAPEAAREAFARLAHDGPAPVEELLGRGWWGRGMLPPPLDWLQRRALVGIGDDGLVHATAEAREGYLELTLALPEADGEDVAQGVRVEPAGSVVVAPTPGLLDRAVGTSAAALRAVSPTVAVSPRSPGVVSAALRAAGVRLDGDALVEASASSPALPGTSEQAVGPRAVRALLERAVAEGRQVRLQYYASSRGGAATDRVVDPWAFADDLLRGYCHLRAGERTFAVDRVGKALLLPSPIDVAPSTG